LYCISVYYARQYVVALSVLQISATGADPSPEAAFGG
jgi:hypothetical protein